MPYAVVNRTGCAIRKGNCQIRLDFYLDETDPRYNERYLEINGVWQNTPFHTHFIYLPATFTEEDIKAQIDIHLKNFYQAFQDRWDEVKGGMRHGWVTQTRTRPTDYRKTGTPSKYNARVAECQDAIDALTPFVYEPEEGGEGKTFPATEIDIGPGAIDRASAVGSGKTNIDLTNPANDTGTIDTFEVWATTTLFGTNRVGTFHGSGTEYTNRDGEAIGTVTLGAKRTFTGLDIDVTSGDFAGIYYSAGTLEFATSGGSGLYYINGDQFGTGEQTYTLGSGYAISIYGTGETAGGGVEVTPDPASAIAKVVAPFVVMPPTEQINTSTHDIAGILIKTGADEVIYFCRQGAEHVGNDGKIVKQVYTPSTDSWGSRSDVYTDASYDCRNVAGGMIGTDIYLFFGKYEAVGATWEDIGYIKSTDGGDSWGSYISLKSQVTEAAYGACGSLVGTGTAGTYLQTWLEATIGTPIYKVKVFKTTDSGANWSTSVTLYSGTTKYTEACAAYCGNNKLIALIRDNDGGYVAQTQSKDNGANWGTNDSDYDDENVAITNLGDSSGVKVPHIHYDSSTDHVIALYADRNDNTIKLSEVDKDIVFGSETSWPSPSEIAPDIGTTYGGYPSMVEVADGLYFYVYIKRIGVGWDVDTWGGYYQATKAIFTSPVEAIASVVAPTVLAGSLAITPSAASAKASVVAPTVIKGSISITPSVVEAIGQVVAPTVILGLTTAAPEYVKTLAQVIQPTVISGSITLTPDHADSVAQVAGPTVKTGNVLVSPTPVDAITTAVNPTVIGGALVLTPAFVAAIADRVNPTVLLGSTTATPEYVKAIGTVIPPTVLGGGEVIEVGAVSAIGQVVAPTVVYGSLVITPDEIYAVAQVVAPTVKLGNIIFSPEYVKAIAKAINPTIGGGGFIVEPEYVEAIARGENPEVILGSTLVTPEFVKALAGVIAPTVLETKIGEMIRIVVVTTQYRNVKTVTAQYRDIDVVTS